MARTYGKLSYAPENVNFSMSGYSSDQRPWNIITHKLYKNILLAAYRTPSTAEELAMEMGIALPYMEDELEFLVRESLLRKNGDKYETGFMILSADAQEKLQEHLLQITPKVTELLTQAKIQLAKDGWDLQIEMYDDYQKINEDVLNGTLDAHLFAHQTYMDSFNDVNGTNLVAVDKISYEVYGIYSSLNQDLTKVPGGAAIGIPQDATRKARALLFMQDIGWITLKEEVGITAILEDVIENPKNLQFKEYTQDTISQVMSETQYCVIGADMAISAGMDVEDDVLKAETDSCDSVDAFVSLLITTEENMQEEKIKVLSAALKSAQTKTYVEEIYRGALAVYN